MINLHDIGRKGAGMVKNYDDHSAIRHNTTRMIIAYPKEKRKTYFINKV